VTTLTSHSTEVGKLPLRSAGPIAFGTDNVLFVADNASAVIFAVELVGAGTPPDGTGVIEVENLGRRLAAYLGCRIDDVAIHSLAVDPRSQDVVLSLTRGRGEAAEPVIVRVGPDGISAIDLDQVSYSSVAITDAPSESDNRMDGRLVRAHEEGEELDVQGRKLRIARYPLRTSTVTDLAYVDGWLLVAGASNEEFASTFRRIPFPFTADPVSNSLEIFHVSHGKYETASPIRTFVPYGGGSNVLASYTCTPVVHFSLDDLAPGAQAKGRTVAELGAMNTPLDMVSFTVDGQEQLLVSNTNHPLIKIACRDIDGQESLTTPREPVGVPRQDLPHAGVGLMANLNDTHVVMVQTDDDGAVHLRSYACASL
jgi:hypothetical protein